MFVLVKISGNMFSGSENSVDIVAPGGTLFARNTDIQN